MPIDFTIKGGELVIKAEDLLDPVFEDIWRHDTSKAKTQATAILKYVYFMESTSTGNPLRDRPYYSKERDARAKAFRKADYQFSAYEAAVIPMALEAYRLGNEDTDRRTLLTYNTTIEKMRVIVDNNPPEMIRYEEPVAAGPDDPRDGQGFLINPDGSRRQGKVSWVTNNDMLLKTLKDLNLVAEARDKLQLRMEKDGLKGNKNKGKYESSASEKGMIFAPGAKDKLESSN